MDMKAQLHFRKPVRVLERTVVPSLFLLVLILGALIPAQASEVKNFIYMIGDGMSFEQLAAARIVKGAPLVMDGLPVQHQAANASSDSAITDSAAGATAHATGYRTNNGMVSMLPDGTTVTSILNKAKAAGKVTGVVVTDVLYGATPGAFIANVPRRQDQADILEQAIFSTQPDVMLGGGMAIFNQIKAAERLPATSYQLVNTRDELLAWNTASDAKLLGIFASTTMTYELDRKPNEPHIGEMTQVALDILAQSENGFFLMIEGSRIDHGGHANDLPRTVQEVLAFDQAVAVALAFASQRDDTIVLVTADHETGGLTPGAGIPAPRVIAQGVEAVRNQITGALQKDPATDIGVLFEQYADITDVGSHTHQGNLAGLVQKILADRAFYYTKTDHTGVNVPVLAYGPGAERFSQTSHIADVGQLAMVLLGLPTGGDQ